MSNTQKSFEYSDGDMSFTSPLKFEFTQEQQLIVDDIWERLKKPPEERKNLIVAGRGGVGKTRMVCELICNLVEAGYKVAAGAMTGKATGVLRAKVEDAFHERGLGIPIESMLMVETLSTICKSAAPVGIDGSGKTRFVNRWKNPKAFKYDILVVDELSMVPHVMQKWWAGTDALIIGLGDACQLRPVETADITKEIQSLDRDLKLPSYEYVRGYGIEVLQRMAQAELKTVLRSTGDITLLCNDLRDFTLSNRAVVNVFKKWAKKSEDVIYSTDMADLETGHDWQILTYTNKLALEINTRLMIGTTYPDMKDKILLLDNINPVRMYNGEVFIFQDFLDRIKAYNSDPTNEETVYVCMKWQRKMPSITSKNNVERSFAENYQIFQSEIKRVYRKRIRQLTSLLIESELGAGLVDEVQEMIDKGQQELKNDQEIFDAVTISLEKTDWPVADYIYRKCEKLPKLYVVDADAGYALTVHKAQGSEFEKTCYCLERFEKPLIYTACSRAKKVLKVINLTKTT